jgi:hypothetical protein
MTSTEQAEAELTWKFMQHHMLDDSRDSYVQNGQWAYGLGYRAGLKNSTEERNFCPRCGKRLFGDERHTCTPPKEKT